MPNTKSAKKALRQSIKRRTRNLKRKRAMRDIVKKIKKLVLEKKIEDAKKLIPNAQKAIDKAAKTGVIKKNTASRKKSYLMKLISKQKISLNSEHEK
jgi:small subunit ribosomal protein S20